MQKKNKPMPTLLIKTLGLVLASMLLCYVCTLIAFSTLGLNAYTDLQKSEMHERTAYIADVTAAFFENEISRSRYEYLLGSDKNIWGASVYVYNADGVEIVRTASESTTDDISIISVYMEEVLSGKTVQNMKGIVTGVPVVSSLDNVIGAVFMVKPVHEIQDAMSSVKEALHISLLLSFLVMCVPVYFVASYGIVRPIRTMTEAAEKMAQGDYNTTVDISHSKGEIASLGHSLNELSHSLSKSMGSLKSERNMLREVLNGMEDGVIVFGLNSRMIQHNPAAIQLMDGHNSVPIDCNVMRTIIDNIVKMDMTSNEPLQFNTESGERILHVRISALRSYDSEAMILVLLHDTTEATRYEQSRKDYVANVSHELRTPVTNIKGVSEALLDGLIPEEKLQKYYGHLYKESDRLSRLINDLLELSRMQSGKLSLAKRKTDIHDVVMGVADRFSGTAAKAGIIITAESVPSDTYAYTNEDRIEQVLIILMDNAMKHSESGIVKLRSREEDTQFVISVENDGSISDKDIQHIFERFYKADKSHSGGGSGLGLSIASEIMTLLGESISVKSENGKVEFSFTVAKYTEYVND